MFISAVLVASATFHYSMTPQTKFQVTEMEILFNNQNATANIEYEVGFLTQIYIFFFGSRNLDPYIDELLHDFDEYQVVSVHGTTATIELINSSRYTGTYYLHDKHLLGYEVAHLIFYFPDGKTMTFDNATETLSVFY